MIEALLETVHLHIWYAILLMAFLAVLVIQLAYHWFFFSRLAFFKPTTAPAEKLPVSVIIVVHNQYQLIRQNLPELLGQDYPDFEVLVVDDTSDDGSDEVLEKLAETFSNLRVVKLTQSLNWFKGRKFPLSLGIKSASHEFLLLTDIRFRPEGKNWISQMVAAYTPDTAIALGYATFNTTSKINKWLRFMAFYDGMLYLSMALSGMPFKGIGPNLSYRKSLFYRHKGFSSHYVINAGDDELFVNKAATRKNTEIRISADSQVKCTKPMTFIQWLENEKTRLAIRRFFKPGHRMMISLFSATTLFFYALFAAMLVIHVQLPVIIGIFLIRLLSQLVIFGLIQKKLSEKKLLWVTPIFDLALSFIDLAIWLRMLFTKKSKWS
jgi:poly-beta-1,6-N-acetyl-D-glucosamine synthase